ncbi:ABC transporter permease [Gemella sp. 19428wG2_WT2a]|nr:ABC transporter permease [Gemella sp. 19428wG2_WT2a]TFU60051.1 ABC transporter permease [Gemella sp. WT2a]
MKIYYIAKSEILRIYRNKKHLFMLILFPILMITILSTAFKENFTSTYTLPKMSISYYLSSSNKDYNDNFLKFVTTVSSEVDIEFKKINSEEFNNEKEKLENGELTALIKTEDDKSLTVFLNNIKKDNADFVTLLLKVFIDTEQTLTAVASEFPEKLQNIKEVNEDLVNKKVIESKTGSTSTDYYTISMYTLMGLYGLSLCTELFFTERKLKTLDRISISKSSKLEIIFGKFLGYLGIMTIQLSILFVFSIYVMKANWGNQYWIIGLLTFSLIFFTAATSLFLSTFFKNKKLISNVINLIIPILGLLGGSYIPLSTFQSELLNTLSFLSPLKWMNDSIFYLIFGGSWNPIAGTLLINLGLGTLLLVLAIFSFKNKGVKL